MSTSINIGNILEDIGNLIFLSLLKCACLYGLFIFDFYYLIYFHFMQHFFVTPILFYIRCINKLMIN